MDSRRPVQLALILGLLSACLGAGRLLTEAAEPDRIGDVGAAGAAGHDCAHNLSERFREISEEVGPAVVSIQSYSNGPRGRFRRQQGSGVILTADGILVTNDHVVRRATEFWAHLSDGRDLEAELVGRDALTDLAVLRIDGEQAAHAPLAAHASVGESVLAMGNPFGIGHTVTAGIVSGMGRQDLGIAYYEDFLQTDAAINPGNSGGPLVNLSGEVVGINTAVATPGDPSSGLGFAIPSRIVKKVVDDLVEYGRVRRGWLGVQLEQTFDSSQARARGYEGSSRASVEKVIEGSPAAAVGVHPGDILLSVDGVDVVHMQDVLNQIGELDPGTEIELVMWREGKSSEVTVRLADRDFADVR